MMRLARAAQPQPLGMAMELVLTFATMMIAGGTDVYPKGTSSRFALRARTVASYLGHASVSMTLNIFELCQCERSLNARASSLRTCQRARSLNARSADVDPDAKRAAVSKVQDCFDMDFDLDDEPAPAAAPQATGISFTVEQLEAMLQAAKAQQAMAGMA